MRERYGQVSRKTVEEDRIAICPQFGCRHLEKVKPLKFGFLGFRKYPKCSKHKIYLVFVDEFIGNFIQAINACLFDISSLPPENLINLIKTKAPNGLKAFINGWVYCNSIGRGAQIISKYMGGLANSYMKLLSRKQRKSFQNERCSKKRYEMLYSGLKKIAKEYTNLLQKLREKSEVLHDLRELRPFSDKVRNLVQTWLKGYLNKIHVSNGKKRSDSLIQNKSLSMLKKEYDKILHIGTCTLLLGKSTEIVTKGISAFELFSAYHEFLEAGLCRELKREDIQMTIKDKETVAVLTIKIHHFKQKVMDYLKNLLGLIDGTADQKKFIWSKSLEILDKFISRAENNEFTIRKNTNPKKIAAAIIYTVTISNENIPKISMGQTANIANIGQSDISKVYIRYFKHLYPRTEFLFSAYELKRIKQNISLYFFELIRNAEIVTSELVSHLRENILKNNNIPGQLTRKDINILHEMATQYQDTFIKYFSDLAEVVKQLTISSKVHKKIGALLIIKYLAGFLEEKDVNLLQTSQGFSRSVREIFDFLKEKFPNFFPTRIKTREKLSNKEKEIRDKEYKKVVASRLKLYVIKNIYNGKYFKNRKCKCPECLKEGLIINTDISRLNTLEFHHDSDEKEHEFSVDKLYRIFTSNRSNSHVLEDLISFVESEKVILLCRTHHAILHDKYFYYFNYLINWKNIFSLPAELIHILIMISVNNFYLTRNLPTQEKKQIRGKIVRKLKKSYIIERLYGEYCHTCGEISIKKHLTAFHFNHLDEGTKSVEASDLYNIYSCSKIVRILEQEKGGYLCSNCHTVIHYKYFHLLDKIYEDKKVIKKILDDYNRVSKKFTPIHSKGLLIGDPLKKSIYINKSVERYLTAIYEISKSGLDVTNSTLVDYMGIERPNILNFFKIKSDFIKQYVDIIVGTRHNPTIYLLKDKGRKAISLIYHFKKYYNSI